MNGQSTLTGVTYHNTAPRANRSLKILELEQIKEKGFIERPVTDRSALSR